MYIYVHRRLTHFRKVCQHHQQYTYSILNLLLSYDYTSALIQWPTTFVVGESLTNLTCYIKNS